MARNRPDQSAPMYDNNDVDDFFAVNGALHDEDTYAAPPDNLYPSYQQHGGDPTPQDNNANGSAR